MAVNGDDDNNVVFGTDLNVANLEMRAKSKQTVGLFGFWRKKLTKSGSSWGMVPLPC